MTASAQTNSCPKAGDYWITTAYGGYCSAMPQDQKAAPTNTNGSNWIDAACPNKEPEQAWRECVMAALSAKAKARENASNEQVAQQQQQADYQHQLQQQQQQQYQYQQQLLGQQAEYQRQLLQQQAQLARRQMALQYLMNRPAPTPYMLPMPQMPVYQNNQINCTSQKIGNFTYTNCY